MELSDYGMSRERGYLSHYEIDEITLPDEFAPVLQAAKKLSALLTTGRVRHWLEALPDPQIEDWVETAPEEELRTAMVHYSFLVQAYVWGEPEPPAVFWSSTPNTRSPRIEMDEDGGALQQIQGNGLFAGQRWHPTFHSVLRRQTPASSANPPARARYR